LPKELNNQLHNSCSFTMSIWKASPEKPNDFWATRYEVRTPATLYAHQHQQQPGRPQQHYEEHDDLGDDEDYISINSAASSLFTSSSTRTLGEVTDHDLSAATGKMFLNAIHRRNEMRKMRRKNRDQYDAVKNSFFFDPQTNPHLKTASNQTAQTIEPFVDDVLHWNRSNCGWTMSREDRFSNTFSSMPSFSGRLGGDRRVKTADCLKLKEKNRRYGDGDDDDDGDTWNSSLTSFSRARRRPPPPADLTRPMPKSSKVNRNLGQMTQYDVQPLWLDKKSPVKSSMFKSSSARDLFNCDAFAICAKNKLVKPKFDPIISVTQPKVSSADLMQIKQAENRTPASRLKKIKKREVPLVREEVKVHKHIFGTKIRSPVNKKKGRDGSESGRASRPQEESESGTTTKIEFSL